MALLFYDKAALSFTTSMSEIGLIILTFHNFVNAFIIIDQT